MKLRLVKSCNRKRTTWNYVTNIWDATKPPAQCMDGKTINIAGKSKEHCVTIMALKSLGKKSAVRKKRPVFIPVVSTTE